jgi:hypothetical protein
MTAGEGERRGGLRSLLAWARTALMMAPAALSLSIPRRDDRVVLGAAGPHVDNIVGLLAAGPPPRAMRLDIVASPEHRRDPRLLAAAAAAGARVLRRSSPRSAWAVARAGWILLPGHRKDVWHMALGRSRLVYINHGPWLKAMPPRPPSSWSVRWFRRLFGRYQVVLASTPDEVDDYLAWKGPDVKVIDLGYPRSSRLDEVAAQGLSPHKVGLWPTWKDFDDPSYTHALVRRLHGALVAAGVRDACVELRPHPVSRAKLPDLVVGPDDGRRPALVVTDFSSVAFDQAYVGGRLLLYSRVLQRYRDAHGVRARLLPWLRTSILAEEEALVDAVLEILVKGGRGVVPPSDLKPFDAGAFWRQLEGVARQA